MRLCIIRHTIYDLKCYGLCRERHFLWEVPLLILQKTPLLCRSPAFHAGHFIGKVGDFFVLQKIIMLRQQKADVCWARTFFAAPVLHGAQRDARLLCKSGLRQTSAGYQLSHRQMRHVPDGRQSCLFGIQIYAPVGIVRDAKSDIVEEDLEGGCRVGCHIKKFSCVHCLSPF
nr:MAG TPA: hypothetical protein [Caudoviricetes sp.]